MTEELKCPVCSSELTDNTAFYLCQNAKCLKAWTPIALSQPVRWREVPIARSRCLTQFCGHCETLHLYSVESSYNFCELCEARSELQDALKMEASLKSERDTIRNELAHIFTASNDCECDICERVADKFRRRSATADAELAELLNMLMATNVHGAILQLRDHLDGDKRLLDNYQRLYKFRRGQS